MWHWGHSLHQQSMDRRHRVHYQEGDVEIRAMLDVFQYLRGKIRREKFINFNSLKSISAVDRSVIAVKHHSMRDHRKFLSQVEIIFNWDSSEWKFDKFIFFEIHIKFSLNAYILQKQYEIDSMSHHFPYVRSTQIYCNIKFNIAIHYRWYRSKVQRTTLASFYNGIVCGWLNLW